MLLLRHAIGIPKVLYLLRTAPCFHSPILAVFDDTLQQILSSVLNVDLSSSNAWKQASLPIGHGGLGVRSTSMLAPSTFLSSVEGCRDLVSLLVPSYSPQPLLDQAMCIWSTSVAVGPPMGVERRYQNSWDTPRIQAQFDSLLRDATEERDRARLIAMPSKNTGLWLQAPPSASVGLRMDDEVIRIAAGLRLGVHLCNPHTCHSCGRQVDELATHGLSCVRSQGRHS